MAHQDRMFVMRTMKFRICAVACLLIFMAVAFFGRSKPVQKKSIRDKRPLDTASLTLNSTLQKKLLEDNKLIPAKSRGATIFTDEDGNIRIPPAYILNLMEFRDLEELYHRYVESIQTICKRQIHLGSLTDGGYDICQDPEVLPEQQCLVYSFGVRNDFSFDEELHKAYGCEIHSFDPANGMQDHQHSDKVYFHSMGLGGWDGVMNGNWKMRTVTSIKKELGHANRKIEVMKIDIESGEWPALPEILSSGAMKDVKQLIMEFHSFVDLDPWFIDGRNKQDYRQHLNVLRGLYDEGLRIFFFNRFPANCCIFEDEFGHTRTGCHEVHLMRVT